MLRKSISVVGFTPWQLMKAVQRDPYVFYVHATCFRLCSNVCVCLFVCVHVWVLASSATALWINKQELAFICHSRINLLQEQSWEQRPGRWPQVWPEGFSSFCAASTIWQWCLKIKHYVFSYFFLFCKSSLYSSVRSKISISRAE